KEPLVVINRGVDWNDRLQVRWAGRRDAQRRNPTVRDAPDADAPATPRLTGEPLDDIVAILALLRIHRLGVHTFRVAGAAEVNLETGVALAGEIPVVGLLVEPVAAVLVVWRVLEDGRIA